MSPSRDREDLLEMARRRLFTAVVGNVMDKMDLLRQFLPPRIGPMGDGTIVVGRAMTVLEADVFAEGSGPNPGGPTTRPFGLMLGTLERNADQPRVRGAERHPESREGG